MHRLKNKTALGRFFILEKNNWISHLFSGTPNGDVQKCMGGIMAQSNVVQMNPVVVELDVVVEVPLLFLNVTLCFKTFTSENDADNWIIQLHHAHTKLLAEKAANIERMSQELGKPISPLAVTTILNATILGATREIQRAKMTIQTRTPAIDARNMHVYAFTEAKRIIDTVLTTAVKI